MEKKIGNQIKEEAYDIVHRVTPLGLTAVSTLAQKCERAGVPFVLGPLNGGIPWPKAFDSARRRELEWLSYIRGFYKLLPGHRQMLRSSGAIIMASFHTRSEVPAEHQGKVAYIPENAIDIEKFNHIAVQDPEAPLRACFVGRLVPYKGPDMVLDAAQELLAEGRLTLDIVGDGPMRSQLHDQIDKLGFQDAITLHGNLEHHEVQTVLSRSHLFAFPSIREFGGGVVLEAMALGVVLFVVDYGGPGELVTDAMGFRVPIGSREEIVAGVRAQLASLAEDRTSFPALSDSARQRVSDKFTWPRKAEQVRQVYDWLLGGRVGPMPSYFL